MFKLYDSIREDLWMSLRSPKSVSWEEDILECYYLTDTCKRVSGLNQTFEEIEIMFFASVQEASSHENSGTSGN